MATCKMCGAPLEPKDKFCTYCGAIVTAQPETAATQPDAAPKMQPEQQYSQQYSQPQPEQQYSQPRSGQQYSQQQTSQEQAYSQAAKPQSAQAYSQTAQSQSAQAYSQTAQSQTAQPQSAQSQASQSCAAPPEKNGAPDWSTPGSSPFKPITMWGYFGYELLFSIPIIGLIFILIFSFGGTKNVNLRNFSRSQFCFLIVALIFAVIAIAVYAIVGGSLGFLCQ